MTPQTAARIERVEFMLSTGEHPERICARIGTNGDALCRLLKRNARPDLAAAFEGARRHQRKVRAAQVVEHDARHDWLADADAALGDWRARADAALSWGGAA